MCMQCVANGVVYVGGAVGALQVLKVRARRQRDRGAGDTPEALSPSARTPAPGGP
jgi:hypothetical protein